MTEADSMGLIDTSVLISLPSIPRERLPRKLYISSVTLAEMAQGLHMNSDPEVRALRLERPQWVESIFKRPLSFDAHAARLYGALVGLIVRSGRNPRPRDLMIAATAGAHQLPIYSRNAKDLAGIESRVRVVAV